MIFTERGQFSIHRVTSYFTFLVSRQIRVIRAACAGVQNTAGIKDTNWCFVHSLTLLLNIFSFLLCVLAPSLLFVQVLLFFAQSKPSFF